MTLGEEVSGWPGPLEWQDYQDLLANAPCELINSLGTTRNPFKAVGLTSNPGGGTIQLHTIGDSFPEIEKIQAFDISGRLVFSGDFDASFPTQLYDLSDLPTGVYTILLSNQKWRRGMKYVKAW
jgi:hypothetical protein